MALMAVCMPILPGKLEEWQAMAKKLNEEPLKSQMKASREAAGVRERTFLQETPNGHLVIVTLEGDDPAAAFGKMMNDPAMKEFMEWANGVHGVDFSAGLPPPPELIYDSQR